MIRYISFFWEIHKILNKKILRERIGGLER